MTNKDFENLEQIQRILKYIENGKLDHGAWPNASELNDSLKKLLLEHREYLDHMKHHH